MKLFSEKVTPTFTNSSFNILQVENFSEIFFDVYEIELNKIKYPVEKVSEYKGSPVVSVPVVIGGKEQKYPFILTKGKLDIVFNENNIHIPSEDGDNVELVSETIIHEGESDIEEFENISISEFEIEDTITEDAKASLKLDIAKQLKEAKKTAAEYAEKIKSQKINEATQDIKKRERVLKNTLDDAKADLVSEFVKITKKIREDILNSNNDRYSEISLTIDNKIVDLAESLRDSISDNFSDAAAKFEKSVSEFVTSLHENSTLPEVRKNLTEIASDIVSKVSSIEESIKEDFYKKLENKADIDIVNALRESAMELNSNINKGLNKALSRVGNTNNKIDKVAIDIISEMDKKIHDTSSDIISQIDEKIELASSKISDYYSDKLKFIEEKAYDLNEKSRKYVTELVQESRDGLIEELRKLQKEAPIEYVIESSGKREIKSFDSINSELDKKISSKISDEVIRLKKFIAVYSGGGGSVAAQFADGGVMNGNLTVVGSISAREYLGMSASSGNYLPLSGGTITGSLSVTGSTYVDNVMFSQTPQISGGVGVMRWNDQDGTLDLGLKGSNVTLQLGQEQVVRVVNKTNSDLLQSEYKVVRIRLASEGGAQGQRLAVVLAQGDNDPDSTTTLGVVTEDIEVNQEGFITILGAVRDIDTTGSIQGETWVDGDLLYLSPTVAGGLTKIKPQAPQHTITVGYVEYAHQNNGKIFVKIDNGYELDELHNVKITNPADNQVLTYDSLSGVWKNTTIDSNYLPLSGGIVNGNIVINGSLSANNLVYNSGDQTIAGNKTFTNNVVVNGNITAPNQILATGSLLNSSTLISVLENTAFGQYTGVAGTGGHNTQFAGQGSVGFAGAPTVGSAAVNISYMFTKNTFASDSSVVNLLGGGYIFAPSLPCTIGYGFTTSTNVTAYDVDIRHWWGNPLIVNQRCVGFGGTRFSGFGIKMTKHPTNNTYLTRMFVKSFDLTNNVNISNCSNTSPIVVTTPAAHNLITGDTVDVVNVAGNTAANGERIITVLTPTTFSLNGSVGNGTYTAGTGTFSKISPNSVELPPGRYYRAYFVWNPSTQTVNWHLNSHVSTPTLSAYLFPNASTMPNMSWQTGHGFGFSVGSLTQAPAWFGIQASSPTIYQY